MVILALRIGMVLLLYAFLLALLAAARRELRALAAVEPPAPRGLGAHGPRLILVHPGNGSQRPGLSVDLVGPAGIGRARDNLVVLDDEFVSSHHARVEPRDGGWWLSDRGSTNGTSVNDRPVKGEVGLRPGDVVAIGDVRLKVAP